MGISFTGIWKPVVQPTSHRFSAKMERSLLKRSLPHFRMVKFQTRIGNFSEYVLCWRQNGWPMQSRAKKIGATRPLNSARIEPVGMCQSCGKVIRSASHCGTNFDGSKNPEYCWYCFQYGKYLEPDISLLQMVERICSRMTVISRVSPEKAHRDVMSYLPFLKRWRENEI